MRRIAAQPADSAAPPREAGAQAASLGGGHRRQHARGGFLARCSVCASDYFHAAVMRQRLMPIC